MRLTPYSKALAAFERNDLDAALVELNAAMSSGAGSDPDVFALLGDVLLKAGMADEACEAYEAAAARAPDAFAFHHRAMQAMAGEGQHDKALLFAMRAHRIRDNDPDVNYVIARALHSRGDTETLAHFRNRLTASDEPSHLAFARELIGTETRNPFNLVLHKKLGRLYPDDPFVRFRLMAIAREFCDYPTIESEERWMNKALAAGDESIFEGETPYANLLHVPDERLNRLATNNRDLTGPAPFATTNRRRTMEHRWGDRIRVGYLSADFSSTHATMRLMRRVLEMHDRSRFDVTLYCHTPESLVAQDDDGRASWGGIVPISGMKDSEAAARIRADGIDILVDLKGHTGGSRCQILNHGPAPLQVAWLGFPGSTVNVDLDYVVGDPIVLPESARAHYHEAFIRLPDSYQPNDPVHRPLPDPTDRKTLGLPEDRFVFASFNAQRKITPDTLNNWAEIMRQAPDSVLWAMIEGEQARSNFIARMGEVGIAAERVILTAAVDYPAHIARLQVADLGLDTFPYNGHTTTSDMLWAGLPVLTRRGSNFASRVSESLLSAAGLPELVADDETAFVRMARDFANGAMDISPLARRLSSNRHSIPLFNDRLFINNLERAYEIIVMRRRSGLELCDIAL